MRTQSACDSRKLETSNQRDLRGRYAMLPVSLFEERQLEQPFDDFVLRLNLVRAPGCPSVRVFSIAYSRFQAILKRA
jgi:hypothetical protein